MNKLALAIVLAALTLGVVRFGTAQQPTSGPNPVWKVVNVTRLNNQTNGNFSQTLFTPTETAMFRMTLYSQVVQAATNQSTPCPFVFYTNGLGAKQDIGDELCLNTQPAFGDGQAVVAFQAIGGMPVTLSSDTPPDPTFMYNLIITTERLEATP